MAKDRDSKPEPNEPIMPEMPETPPADANIGAAPPIDPWAVLNSLATSLQVLAQQAQQGSAAPNNAELTTKLTEALVRLSETQLEGSKLIADETRRAHRPSNEVPPLLSVFNRRGVLRPANDDGTEYVKPKLKCYMLIPWFVEWEQCNREEVELLNLVEPGSYIVSRIDRSKIRMDVTMDYKVDNITPHRMLINHETAFNNDNKDLMPALSDWLRQILKQHDPEIRMQAAAVLTDEEEEALIEANMLSVSV